MNKLVIVYSTKFLFNFLKQGRLKTLIVFQEMFEAFRLEKNGDSKSHIKTLGILVWIDLNFKKMKRILIRFKNVGRDESLFLG